MLVFPLRMLGMWIGQAQRATASGERIFQVIDEPEEIARPARRARAAGRARAASASRASRFGYDPDRPVLDGDRPRARAGQDVALIGHTGSGKTTLASLVPRFYDVHGGPGARSTAPTCAT